MGRIRPVNALRLLIVLLFVATLVYALFFAQWRPRSFHAIQHDLQMLGPEAPFAVALLQAILVVFFVPGFLLTIATALLFGVESIPISLLGQSLGAIFSYTLGRFVGHEFIRTLLGQRLIALQRVLEEHAFRYLLVMRFVWVVPLPLLTYGPGFLRVRFRTFLGATVIGEMPFIIVIGLFAHRLVRLRRASDALDPQFVFPALLLLILLTIPLLLAFLGAGRPRRPTVAL